MALFHSDTGSVSYTLVGTPTIVDGVMSNINGSNYARIVNPDLTSVDYLDVSVTCTMPSVANEYAILFRSVESINMYTGGGVGWIDVQVRPAGETTDIRIAEVPYETNETLTIRLIWKDYVYKVYKNGTLVNTYVGAAPVTSSTTYITIGSAGSSSGNWLGSIDLGKTYIKINNSAYYGKCPIEVKNFNYSGPVGYTKIGSPTINNGVASGFSGSDYLQTNSNLPSNSNMEFNIKFTAGVSGGVQGILGSPASNIYFGVKLMSYNQLDIILSYDGGNTDNVLDTKISQNTTYSLNCKLTNNKLLASLKNAIGEELEYKEFDFSHELRQTSISFGYSGTSTYFNGSIDLNNTYIKVNGKLWFFQPKVNYIIKDGKLVWASEDVYIETTEDQYQHIDTGVSITALKVNPRIVTKFKMLSQGDYDWFGTAASSYQTILYDVNSSTDAAWIRWGSSAKRDYSAAGSGASWTAINFSDEAKTLDIGGVPLTGTIPVRVNGEQVGELASSSGADLTNDTNLLLLGARNFKAQQLYFFKIYANGELIRHFVPVPQGMVIGSFTVPSNGMFDIVNQQFYANLGNGTLSIGYDSTGGSTQADTHTLLLLHLDDSLEDSVSGLTPYTSTTETYYTTPTMPSSFGKFLFGCDAYYRSNSFNAITAATPFTLDFWVNTFYSRYNSYGHFSLIGTGNKNLTFYVTPTSAGTLKFDLSDGVYAGDKTISYSDSSFQNGEFAHIALVYDGSVFRIFCNGHLVDQSFSLYGFDTTNWPSMSELVWISQTSGSIDEVRFSDVARWTEDFTPPTEPYS